MQKFSHQHFFTKISWNQQINTYLKSNDFTEFSQKMAAQCENHWNLHSHSLGKNFVKATFLLSKELISRIFLWWENISRFYIALGTPQCGNYGNSLLRTNFVKGAVLLNKLLKRRFDDIFLWWERIFRFSTLCT